MVIEFEVPEVRGQGRPRFSKFSGAYKDRKDIEYERLIRECFYRACEDEIKNVFNAKVDIPSKRPIVIEITAVFKIPKNLPKYVKEEIKECDYYYVPQTKPDLDNIAKAVLDALNGIAYDDDKQVVELACEKGYSSKDHSYLHVLIRDDQYKTVEDIKNERRRH